jgi:Holliday junction resolvase
MEQSTEEIIRNLLRSKFFTVNDKDPSSNGVDIVAIKDGHYFLIEVKCILQESNSFRVRLDHDSICDFTLSLTESGYLIPWMTKNSSISKMVRFFTLL